MTLRARFAVVLTVTVLLPLLAVGALVGVLGPGLVTQTSAERLRVTADAAASALSTRCTALGLAARSLALEAAPALASRDAAPPGVLEQAVGALDGASAALLDETGAVLAAVGEADLARSHGRSCSGGGEQGGGAEGQVESVPVRDSEGAVVGWAVVHAPLSSAVLETVRQRAALPAGLLLVQDGETAASATEQMDVGEAEAAAVARAVTTAEDEVTGEVEDVRYTVRAVPAAAPGLLVAVLPARDAALLRAVAVVLPLAALLAAAGTVVLARRLTAPLAELTATVLRLADGDLGTRTRVGGRDEVGRLAAAVNTLADALQGSIADADAGRDAAAGNLERFTEALARSHDLDGLLHTVAEAAASAAGADTSVVYVEDGHGLVERAVVDREVHSAVTSPRLLETARRAMEQRAEVTDDETPGVHVVALPLLYGDRPLGAVVLAARRPPEREDLAAARSLARPAATAVSNVLVHRETARLSLTDPLTGLANFRSLSDTLAREIERAARFGRPLAVLMLDLDHFKTINDTWGHAVGDTVLVDLGARLHGLVRDVDTVARYGGEEFAIVLPETHRDAAGDVAQRVVTTVRREPFGRGALDEPLRVTVSVGVARYPEDGETAGELMRAADAALYDAKRAGRDRWAASGANAGNALSG